MRGFFIIPLLLWSVAGAAGFFKSEVKFFEIAQPETTIIQKGLSESVWAEPVVMPDGSKKIYVPPAEVTEFLDNPTESNAKKYLKWQEEKLTRIMKATEILQKVAGEKQVMSVATAEEIKKPQTPTEADSLRQVDLLGLTSQILYFTKEGCKYCYAEDLVMDLFNKRYKNNVRLTGYWIGDKNKMPKLSFSFEESRGLEDKFRISIFPAMIFFLPGKPGPVKLEGFVDGVKLMKFYQQILSKK